MKRRRLPITELSLATVADQYLAHVRAAAGFDREALSDFLVVAARLVLLKSRALLPAVDRPEEGEGESTEDLLIRLETYRTFKLIAEQLGGRERAATRAFVRGLANGRDEVMRPTVLAPISVEALASGFRSSARDRAPGTAPEAERVTRVEVGARMTLVRERMRAAGSVAWEEVGRGTVDEIVATLLAILELVRRGELRVEQSGPFGVIRLHPLDRAAVADGGGAQVGQA